MLQTTKGGEPSTSSDSTKGKEKKKNTSNSDIADEEEDERVFNPYESMILLNVFPCRPGYCLKNNTCVNGSTDVLCSGCMPNHAMASGTCGSCESDVDLGQMRIMTAIGVLIGGFFAWLLLCAMALLPQLQSFLASLFEMSSQAHEASESAQELQEQSGMLSDCAEATTECVGTAKETVENCLPAELFEGDAAAAMFKIVISFYQVVSGFLNFNVSRHTSFTFVSMSF